METHYCRHLLPSHLPGHHTVRNACPPDPHGIIAAHKQAKLRNSELRTSSSPPVFYQIIMTVTEQVSV